MPWLENQHPGKAPQEEVPPSHQGGLEQALEAVPPGKDQKPGRQGFEALASWEGREANQSLLQDLAGSEEDLGYEEGAVMEDDFDAEQEAADFLQDGGLV